MAEYYSNMYPPGIFSPRYVVVTIICAILAIGGGVAVYFTFMSPKKEGRLTGFAAWLHQFLNFKLMLAEMLLKLLYVISALWITLSSLGNLLFSTSGNVGAALLGFLIIVVFGNVALRIVYEFLLVLLVICRNTTEINRRMGGQVDAPRSYEPDWSALARKQYASAPQPAQYVPPTPQQYAPPTPSAQPVSPAQPAPSEAPAEQPEARKFCYNCGSRVGAGDSICQNCGAAQQ